MERIDELLENNARFVAAGGPVPTESGRPTKRLAVVTCMDARIDVFAVLGLAVGEAHVLRNAGARFTPDVLRGLALSHHALGVDTVAVIQHTSCGVASGTNEQLRELTGADLDFLAIDDHATTITEDVEALFAIPYLEGIRNVAGLLYDVDTGALTEIVRRSR